MDPNVRSNERTDGDDGEGKNAFPHSDLSYIFITHVMKMSENNWE
jgi:hypothetical protein